jgi:hypothetical protein
LVDVKERRLHWGLGIEGSGKGNVPSSPRWSVAPSNTLPDVLLQTMEPRLLADVERGLLLAKGGKMLDARLSLAEEASLGHL